jgi:glycerophosphoryl diester phosphodiesterase
MIRFLILLFCSLLPSAAGAGPLIAAHRGLIMSGVSENSLEAIRAAVAAGVDVVEIDLRTTSDRAIVLVHDATVDRVTRGRGRVARLTLAQITSLPLRTGAGRIATLEEALHATRGTGTRLLLDLKSPGAIDPAHLLAVAKAHGALDHLIIGSRSAAEVMAYRRLYPSLPILGFMPRQGDIEQFASAGADIVRLWARWIARPAAGCLDGASSACVVQKLQSRGLRVWALADAPSSNQPARICFEWLGTLQTDGILTNQPLLARETGRGRRLPFRFPGYRQCGW